MDSDNSIIPTQARTSAPSHQDYLNSLVLPSAAELARIAEIQERKEEEVSRKYQQHSTEEQDAAKLIQRAYRGHRERRQLDGLTLDPTSRWMELRKELRYRGATAPHRSPSGNPEASAGLPRSSSDRAMANWRRVREIADRAGAGEGSDSHSMQHAPPEPSLKSNSSVRRGRKESGSKAPQSMLLDMRYFLEMVDQKHRYGSNLQVYHSEWRQKSTNENFFYWLDQGEGRDVDLIGCPRTKLDRERIRYLSREERQQYLVHVDPEGLLRWDKNDELITTSVDQYQDSMYGIVPAGTDAPTFNDEDVQRRLSEDASFSSKLATVGGAFKDALKAEPESNVAYVRTTSSSPSSSSSSSSTTEVEVVDDFASHEEAIPDATPTKKNRKKLSRLRVSPATILNHLLRAYVRPGTWIYVADTVGRLYVGIKSSGSFQHASFLSGARISSAGTIGIDHGKLIYLSPLSGHYRPTTKSFRHFIANMRDQGVDTSHLKVSKSYSVLLGMELYGTSKKATRHLIHPQREAKTRRAKKDIARKNELLHPLTLPVSGDMSATDTIEENWYRRATLENDKKGLAKLMDDLNIRRERRRSEARRRTEDSNVGGVGAGEPEYANDASVR